MEKIYVMAELEVNPEHLSEVEDLLLTVALASQNEKGCESYRILRSTEKNNALSTLEKWSSQEAERLHWETEHVKMTVEKLDPFLLSPPIISKYIEIEL